MNSGKSRAHTASIRRFRRKLRRVTVRSAQEADALPSSIYIEGVDLPDRNRVGGGGYADVYKGVLDGTQVAVKQVRRKTKDKK